MTTDYKTVIADAFKLADGTPDVLRRDLLVKELTAVLALKPDMDGFSQCVQGNLILRVATNRAEWQRTAIELTDYMIALFQEVEAIKENLKNEA